MRVLVLGEHMNTENTIRGLHRFAHRFTSAPSASSAMEALGGAEVDLIIASEDTAEPEICKVHQLLQRSQDNVIPIVRLAEIS
jgi:hypothetical protein